MRLCTDEVIFCYKKCDLKLGTMQLTHTIS